MAGVDLRTVAELLGHKKIQMTMRYSHLAPQRKQDAVNRLSTFSASVASVSRGRPKGRGSVTLRGVSARGGATVNTSGTN